MSGVRIAGEGTSYFHFAYSSDINSCLSVKIGSLEGQLPKPDYEQVNKMYKFFYLKSLIFLLNRDLLYSCNCHECVTNCFYW